jgi:hypothetical protein
MKLLEVKSMGGSNFVDAASVIAIQTTPTGQSIIVMQGGATVQSTELPKAIAARIEEALLNT